MYENATFSTITAHPGFFVAMPIYDNDGLCRSFHEAPVVAWNVFVDGKAMGALEGNATAIPVIPEEKIDEIYFIKMPDGTYDLPEDGFGMTKKEALNLINEGKKGAEA